MQKYPTCTNEETCPVSKEREYLSTHIFYCLMICHYQTHRVTVTQTKANPLIWVTSLSCLTPWNGGLYWKQGFQHPCEANRRNFRKCTDLCHLNTQLSLDFIVVHWCFTLYIWLSTSFLFDCSTVGSTHFNRNQDNRNVPIASELEFKFIVVLIPPLEACDSEVNLR